MRQTIGGNQTNTTAATQAHLASTVKPLIFDLYIIGPPESPLAIYMTNYDSPLVYLPYPGIFQPSVVSRDNVQAKIGLDSQELAITWSPNNQTSSLNTTTQSPFSLAAQHFYDNAPVLILRCFMPTPGDANTLGCTVWFGGRVDTCKVSRNKLVFNVKSYLDVVSQKVPSTVIEVTNTLASTAAVTIPTGDASIPTFACFAGSSETQVIADATSPTSGKIYSGNLFTGGYMVFLSGAGATLAGIWSAIGANGAFTDGNGNQHSQFSIYQALPYPPTPGVDTFYVSMTAPVDLGSSAPQSGFPFVPNPAQAT